MNVTLTPEQVRLLDQLHDIKGTSTVITKVLNLKLQGKSHKEIAATLGYSSQYIDNLSHKALKAYREHKGV